MSGKFNTYKGYPLVRSGDQLYYGYMCDPYVIWIQILDKKETDNGSMTSKARIIQIDTNETDPLNAYVKNKTFECGLYEALDIAKVWLDKALNV